MMFKKYLKLFALIAAVIPATINAQAAKLYIEDFSINPGETKTINIIMENSDIQVWQAQLDVRLPEGLSVTKDEGDLNIELLRNDNKNKHSLDASETEGVIRILVSTTSDKIIKGTEGEFIALEIVADANFKSGVIKLEKMKLVPLEGETVIPADSECQVNGTQPTTVSIKANDLTMVYGDAVPELTYTVTDGEALGTPALSCEATSESPVGTYPIVITEGTLTNDVKNLTNGTLTITKAPLTITAMSYTIQQGDALPEFEVTYSGFKNNETKGVLITEPEINCTASDSSVPGDYDIVASNAEAENYDISYVDGKLTIEETSGIQTITFDGKAGHVYDMSGRRVRENATTLEGLSKGVYIFNGHKVVKQ